MTSSILALHHGYRIAGGEERAAEQLAVLAEAQLGERVSWLRRDSTELSAAQAARGLLAGGIGGQQVRAALEESGADLLHAHNLFPTFGPAALRAARLQGAGVVVHLHNSRLICAVATNVREGADCTACRAGWSVPGVIHRCRGSAAESLAYGAALPRWRREVVRLADVVIVPSMAARGRLLAMGLGVGLEAMHVVGGVASEFAEQSGAADGRFALAVGRLAAEKDLATAIAACASLRLPLVIAGDGPQRAALEQRAGARAHASAAAPILGPKLMAALAVPPSVHGSTVFLGRVDDPMLALLRAEARVAIVASLAHETFGLAALEAMAAAIPTVASRVGALPELVGENACVAPGDARALTVALREFSGNAAAGVRAAARAREVAGPEVVGERLASAYAAAREQRLIRRTYR